MMSIIDCELILEYHDERTAQMIASSIEPDNEEYIHLEVEGNIIRCTAEASSSMQLLHTLDDLLSCLNVAENTLEKNDQN